MNKEIQNPRVSQIKANSIGNAEKAFAYNILIPDLAIFVLGMSGAFGALLTVFS